MSGAVDSPSTAASSVRSVSSATTFSEAADDNDASSGSSESDTVDPFSDDESSNPDTHDTYDGLTDTASIVSHSAAVVGLTGPPYVSFATDLLADYEVRHGTQYFVSCCACSDCHMKVSNCGTHISSIQHVLIRRHTLPPVQRCTCLKLNSMLQSRCVHVLI
jgi:hypothetical protein